MAQKKLAQITIIGKPNAGKSTLLNYLVGQKIAIVTPKVQTTRSSITGIVTKGDTQLIFIDTPGIFNAQSKFEKAMVRCAWSNMIGSDFTLFIIDSTKPFDQSSIGIMEKLSKQKNKVIFALNKIDVQKSSMENIIESIKTFFPDPIIFPISALKGNNLEQMMDYIKEHATLQNWLYDEEDITNLPSRFLASEITREQLFLQMQQELPYKLNVESESWEILEDNSVKINQVIIVSKQNYKAMILGNKGERIKQISMRAREEISKALDLKVHLFLFVKVREDWTNDPFTYKYMGLQ